ncbi:hypothetical protein F4776DRAFT_219164 [Hypoxylon sp. NC0597]|nr:hypothetical protein F4776DRAFT_219164 [Hypoxylon sp. NC0597]
MSVVSPRTDILAVPGEESHAFRTDLIRPGIDKNGLRSLCNYSLGYFGEGVVEDPENFFYVFETAYKHWYNWYSVIPVMEKVVILLRTFPKDCTGPEFAGYLLTEWEDPEYPGLVGLVMVPRPQEAHMSLEEFWEDQFRLERSLWDPDFIGTRHGLCPLKVRATQEWVMSVDQDNSEGLETPDEAARDQLRQYRRERCRRLNTRIRHRRKRARCTKD